MGKASLIILPRVSLAVLVASAMLEDGGNVKFMCYSLYFIVMHIVANIIHFSTNLFVSC